MHNLYHAMDRLEAASDNKQELVTYPLPELQQIVDTIKLLPREEQQEFMGRLERISMLLEGQMLELADELAELRKQIPQAQNNNVAAQAYRRTVAVLPVHRAPANDAE